MLRYDGWNTWYFHNVKANMELLEHVTCLVGSWAQVEYDEL